MTCGNPQSRSDFWLSHAGTSHRLSRHVRSPEDTLDGIYEDGSSENDRITAALDAYGKERFANELKYCIDELLQVCESGTPDKLRGIIFSKPSSNAFPAVFAILIIALHESLVGGQRKVASYGGIKGAITGLRGIQLTGAESFQTQH